MQPIHLFNLAAKQAHWLSVRQDVVAGNVANTDTPGYEAREVEPFSQVLERANVSDRMAADDPRHFVDDTMRNDVAVAPDQANVAIKPSGNSVSLSHELMESTDIRRSFELNTSIVKSFHQMMMMAVKS
ncbi:flagellar basal body rod protein FlgB [Pararhizobium mangrovi]|uniref:Flagellar basal body rod protein FlgB n=1 Tax=Pararhizobium mangrovi TaxID=2590452 RepID=A0A506TZZ7_9HYPH|nr:flagellar basal body rod protein FlgB [Pararhizobium mangrovi]TPW26886.1 flagellar basal body rod protein FlgB [Pararhizobium mangrovi]